MRTHKLKGVKSQAGEVNESNVLGRIVLALERSSNSSSLAVAISSWAEASPVFTDLGFFQEELEIQIFIGNTLIFKVLTTD